MKKTTYPFSFAVGELPKNSALPLPQRSQYFLSPFRPSSSSSTSIPFLWEHKPGIPKFPRKCDTYLHADRIPIPPPIRFRGFSPTKKKRSEESIDADPFAVALVECTKDPPAADPELEEFFRQSAAAARRRKSASLADAGGFSLLGLYSFCKACCVVDTAVYVPRSVFRNRRFG
ncbi:hypothetical protein HPP92_003138 [Vanilla planifolia]|uniref:Uncharacterized protein n=1 Tax=Vanilla planifolia TaxID=51239 RepID=A0A835S6K9_VANPL|nr:hypothetical protein HPP92_003138 [Vanilla planifolia]